MDKKTKKVVLVCQGNQEIEWNYLINHLGNDPNHPLHPYFGKVEFIGGHSPMAYSYDGALIIVDIATNRSTWEQNVQYVNSLAELTGLPVVTAANGSIADKVNHIGKIEKKGFSTTLYQFLEQYGPGLLDVENG
jgi:hypothetical protein